MLGGNARAADVEAAAVRRAAMLGGFGAGGRGRRAARRHGRARRGPRRPTDRLGRARLEWKLDVSAHPGAPRGRCGQVFTRRGNDVTAALPEVADAALRLTVQSMLLDGEAIGLHADGRPRPFQETMRRFGRRLDVGRLRAEVPITPMFDTRHLGRPAPGNADCVHGAPAADRAVNAGRGCWR